LHYLNIKFQNKIFNLVNLEEKDNNYKNTIQNTFTPFFNSEDNVSTNNNDNDFNFYLFLDKTNKYLDIKQTENDPNSLNILLSLCSPKPITSINALENIFFQKNISPQDIIGNDFS